MILKRAIIFLGIVVLFVFWVVSMNSGPSQKGVFFAKEFMRLDMNEVINGGRIIKFDGDRKFKGKMSFFYAQIEADSMGLNQLQILRKRLEALNWTKSDEFGFRYCKKGAEAEISLPQVANDGIKFNSISMEYSGAAIKRCSAGS